MPIRRAVSTGSVVLVAVDFSECCRRALRKAIELTRGTAARLVALNVIDQRFVEECARRKLGNSDQINRQLFMDAKSQLKAFLEEEGIDPDRSQAVVCKGIPHLEITRYANKLDASVIVIGSRGMAGDSEAIFFGGTAEKVLRFISRPVLCVPPSDESEGRGPAQMSRR
jgi:nucleotide-binding universal stress UspA family protein